MTDGLRVIQSSAELTAALKTCSKAVLFFWASWSAPCKHMQQVLEALAKQHKGIACMQVEAEEVDDITEQYGVTTVPYFVFLQDGKEADRLEGADAPGLTDKVTRLAAAGPVAAPAASKAPAAPAAAGAPVDVVSRIKGLLSGSPVVLFMKGSAASPYCGFSRKVVDALTASGVQQFKDVDILNDEELRQALKEYSNWPTYPQLYVGGELVGGCDIVLEMQQTGELQQLIKEKAAAALQPPKQQQQQQAPPPAPAAAPGPAGLTAEQRQRLEQLLQQQPVMLFMKGNPEAPRCGFSRKVVDALDSTGLGYGTFDILGDEFVRQGLKQLSNWPTYPQVYVQGELLGGCDIVLEMQQAGELKLNIEEMLHRMQNAD